MRQPAPKSITKYGMTTEDWDRLGDQQGWVCPICKRGPPEVSLVTDHEHAPRWRYRPPHERKLYVRGLACQFCNLRMIPKGMTLEKAARIALYFQAYEARRPRDLPLPKVRKKKRRRAGLRV